MQDSKTCLNYLLSCHVQIFSTKEVFKQIFWDHQGPLRIIAINSHWNIEKNMTFCRNIFLTIFDHIILRKEEDRLSISQTTCFIMKKPHTVFNRARAAPLFVSAVDNFDKNRFKPRNRLCFFGYFISRTTIYPHLDI